MKLTNLKKAGAGIVSIVLAVTLSACGSIVSASGKTAPGKNAASTQATAESQEQIEEALSAFEITALQRKLAADNEAGYPVLDAGRGNPNWINGKVRHAFTRLMDFATSECELVYDNGDMAGHGNKEGISERFDSFMDEKAEADKFLIDAVDHCVKDLNMNKDDLLFELSNGITGDYYPTPSRCLTNTESILNEFLVSALFNGKEPKKKTDIFPTEGGSAAMTYIFHTLNHNRLLKPGDKIAISTPIFTPYLEIPNVNNYGLVPINVVSDEAHNWDIDEKELDKLKDKSIKAFFLVNPSNPASHALSSHTLDALEKVVSENPDLIILTDDVYGTFVEGFESVYSRLPYNTILVYSFSKLYGATGWRTGLIAMSSDNVCDHLLDKLSEEDKKTLWAEYEIAVPDPPSMKFIERLTADSRSIGLYHTSGLSTPSQVFMDIMALSHTTYAKDKYIELANKTVNERYIALMDALGIDKDLSGENAEYYTIVDINAMIENQYGSDFAQWKRDNKSDLDFLNDLAQKKGVVLMYGPGFDAPEGSVRISLANLYKDDYVEIAKRILELLDEYYAEFEKEALKEAA